MTIKISEQLDRIESALTHVVTKDEFHEEISRIDNRLEKVEIRLENLETRLENLEARLENLEARLDNLEVRLDNLEVRLENLEARLDNLEVRLDSLEVRLDNLEARIEILEKKYTSLEKITKKTLIKMISMSDDISKIGTKESQITRLNVDINQYKDLLVSVTSNYSNTIPFIEKRLDSIDNKVNRFEEEMAIWRIYFNKERP